MPAYCVTTDAVLRELCLRRPSDLTGLRLVRGVGAAFVFGLFMDVHRAGLLGQHALVYTALSYLAIMVHRRILWFPVSSQALQVLPLLMAVHVLELIVRLISGDGFPNWSFWLAPFLQALLWPVVSLLLLMPQHRAHDPDENRPL